MRAQEFFENLLGQADVAIGGSRPQDIQVLDAACFDRWMKQGTLAFGESFMRGQWQCASVDTLFFQLFKNRDKIEAQLPLSTPARILNYKSTLTNRQSRKRATQVANLHYNIDHRLYTRMLDPFLQYSCGIWGETADDLSSAQLQKLHLIAEKLKLEPGMRVLDIGCGWGGLSYFLAAHFNVKVTGITVSESQLEYANRNFTHLDTRFILTDYRNLPKERFDRIVSVEMIEAVGYKNLRNYFNVAFDRLEDDGLFLLQAIGNTRTGKFADPWLDKYVFVNGLLPSAQQIFNALPEPVVVEDWQNLTLNYERTLLSWFDNLRETWDEGITGHSKESEYYRMWKYYLLSCAGNFRSRSSAQLWQIVFSKQGRGIDYDAVRSIPQRFYDYLPPRSSRS